MARSPENMSYAELPEVEGQTQRLKIEDHNAERIPSTTQWHVPGRRRSRAWRRWLRDVLFNNPEAITAHCRKIIVRHFPRAECVEYLSVITGH